jgi:tripartite-type tricarboxylate transporter receptor subunit TctC
MNPETNRKEKEMLRNKGVGKVLTLISLVLLTGSLLAFCPSAEGAPNFPKKPVTLICIYDAGSTSDMIIRPLADMLSKELGQRVIVVNKVGGTGTLGMAEIARVEPDGYTIGMVTFGPLAISPHLMKVAYKLDDFDYFGAFSEYVYGLVCSAKRPWKDVKDVVAYAKANPGKLRHGWASHPNALPMLMLAEKEKLDIKFVPTTGGAESETLLAGGHIDTDCRHPSILKTFTEDQIRFLNACGDKRWDLFGRPDRPTLIEAGYDIDVRSFMGLGAPKGIPAEARKVLVDAYRKVSNDQKTKDMVLKVGLAPTWIDGPEYEKLIRDGYKLMGPAVQKLKK